MATSSDGFARAVLGAAGDGQALVDFFTSRARGLLFLQTAMLRNRRAGGSRGSDGNRGVGGVAW